MPKTRNESTAPSRFYAKIKSALGEYRKRSQQDSLSSSDTESDGTDDLKTAVSTDQPGDDPAPIASALPIPDSDIERQNLIHSVIRALPPRDIKSGPCLLPPSLSPERRTLVLDLDETLVHFSTVEPSPGAEKPEFTFNLWNGKLFTVRGNMRPFAKEFLAKVAGTTNSNTFLLRVLGGCSIYGKSLLLCRHCL